MVSSFCEMKGVLMMYTKLMQGTATTHRRHSEGFYDFFYLVLHLHLFFLILWDG